MFGYDMGMSEGGETHVQASEHVMSGFSQNLRDVVGDGLLIEGDREIAIFPMISTCVPVVITDENDEIVESIHADRNWSPERLRQELIRHGGPGKLHVRYADRKSINNESIENMLNNNLPRKNLIDWLAKQAGEEGFATVRTVLPADRHLRHIGYIKGRGFVNITTGGN